jgi:hypothetical protein
MALLACAAMLGACSERARPVPVEVEPVSADPAPLPTVVTEHGEPVDPETARAIGEALRQLQNGASEPLPAADRAAARDASALHGRWNIVHTIFRTNGEGGEPSPPIVPTSWEFTPEGAFLARGGNAIDARYTYTGDRVIISGFGPVQDYRVDRLEGGELHLTSVIEAGSVRIENTTVLNRAR